MGRKRGNIWFGGSRKARGLDDTSYYIHSMVACYVSVQPSVFDIQPPTDEDGRGSLGAQYEEPPRTQEWALEFPLVHFEILV